MKSYYETLRRIFDGKDKEDKELKEKIENLIKSHEESQVDKSSIIEEPKLQKEKTNYDLYLEERAKRLDPFDIPDEEDMDKDVTSLKQLNKKIPDATKKEKEHFYKFLDGSEVTAVNARVNELYGKDFDEDKYDHEAYLKDKQLINKHIIESKIKKDNGTNRRKN
jgi:hypothetical protein